MPIYEFECQDCEQPFEELVFGSPIEGVVCPTCGGQRVRKKMSTFASKIGGSGAALSLGSSPAPSCNTGST